VRTKEGVLRVLREKNFKSKKVKRRRRVTRREAKPFSNLIILGLFVGLLRGAKCCLLPTHHLCLCYLDA
jgi:hypothetical protein